jgi:membrane protease YdiL (CAAX protease family)
VSALASLVRRQAVILFAVLVVVLTFASYLLPLPEEGRATLVPMVVSFMPLLVAVALTALGGESVRALLRQLFAWRLGWKWLGITLGLTLVLRLGVSLLALLLGRYEAPYIGEISPLLLLTPVFAAFEEIGWRGYALPRLLPRMSPLAAALVLGIPWAGLHLVLFLPGMWSAGESPIPQVSVVLLLSVLTAWAYVRNGRHGVIASTLIHGGQNGLVFLNGGVTPATLAPWLMVVVYALVTAGVVVADARVMLGRRAVESTAVTSAV